MIGFGIDQVQAEYVAEIKLRNINKEYILKRVAGDRAPCRMRSRTWRIPWHKPGRIRKIIIGELEDVKKKYAVPRRTEIVYSHEMPEEPDEEPVEDYPVHRVPVPGGVFQEDHAPVPADVRRAEVQGGRRPAAVLRRPPTAPSCMLLHGSVPGVQEPCQ